MFKKQSFSSTPQLREIDELCSVVSSVMDHHFDSLTDRFQERTTGLSCDDLTKALTPFLFSEPVPLHRRLKTPAEIGIVIQKLFSEATSARRHAAIFWDPFLEFVVEGHRRHVLRVGQQRLPTLQHVGAFECVPTGIRQVVPLSSTADASTDLFVMRDDGSRRFLELYDSKWSLRSSASAALSAVVGMPTAICAVPAPYHKLVSCVSSTIGSSLVIMDHSGKITSDVALLTHQTVARWLPRLGRIVCGSGLGEISVWMPTGKVDPTMVQQHNGPVVLLDHMELHDAVVSVGTDGSIAITDAPTVTRVRVATVTAEHVTCAAFHPTHNLMILGGGSATPQFCVASLPPGAAAVALQDSYKPHRHVLTDVLCKDDLVLSLDASGIIKLWDLRTTKCLDTLDAPIGEEQRKTASFSRLLNCGEEWGVGATSSENTYFLAPDKRTAASHTAKADETPIEFIDSVRGFMFVTTTLVALKLWSSRTGELLGSSALSTFSSAVVTAVAVSDGDNKIFIGRSDGSVTILDIADVLAGSEARCLAHLECVVEGKVTCLVCCGRLLFVAADAQVVVVDSSLNSVCGPVVGLPGALRAELFSDLSGVALLSPGYSLFIVEAEDSAASPNVEDFREYNLRPSLRFLEETHSGVFCFIGSATLIAVADGSDVSIVTLTSGKSRRLSSFSTVNTHVTSMAFESANGKAVLVTVEADGTCAVYLLTDFLDAVHNGRLDHLGDGSRGPPLHSTFSVPRAYTSAIVPQLSACVVATRDCICTVHRFDGVKVGDFDIFRSGSRSGWLPIASRTRRGSNIVFRVNYDTVRTSRKSQVCRHAIPMGTQHPLVGCRPLPSSPTPHLVHTEDSLMQLTFAQRISSFRGSQDVKKVCSLRNETSTRTLQPRSIDDSKWTTDEPEHRPERDGMKVLMGARLLTKGLLPSPALVKQCKNISRSVSSPKSHNTAQQTRRPRLLPLARSPTPNGASPLLLVGVGSNDDLDDDIPTVEQFFVL